MSSELVLTKISLELYQLRVVRLTTNPLNSRVSYIHLKDPDNGLSSLSLKEKENSLLESFSDSSRYI